MISLPKPLTRSASYLIVRCISIISLSAELAVRPPFSLRAADDIPSYATIFRRIRLKISTCFAKPSPFFVPELHRIFSIVNDVDTLKFCFPRKPAGKRRSAPASVPRASAARMPPGTRVGSGAACLAPGGQL
jgi:hypothetical protein